MKITTVVITKNSENKLERCLESAKLLGGEILVIDGGSTDRTVEIAKKCGARVVRQREGSYSTWRDQGIEEAKTDWIFYLDSDEEIPFELAKEIIRTTTDYKLQTTSYAIPRRNIIFGHEMRWGGWWPDYVKRLFRKDSLKKWVGDLHEEPVLKVEDPERSRREEMGHLKNPIIHHKHDHVSEMIEKTNKWSETEARLLYESGHPKMTWWRFFRIIKTEIFYRYIWKLGFLDGTSGAVYALYQAFSRFITYVKLWELQKTRNERKNSAQ